MLAHTEVFSRKLLHIKSIGHPKRDTFCAKKYLRVKQNVLILNRIVSLYIKEKYLIFEYTWFLRGNSYVG